MLSYFLFDKIRNIQKCNPRFWLKLLEFKRRKAEKTEKERTLNYWKSIFIFSGNREHDKKRHAALLWPKMCDISYISMHAYFVRSFHSPLWTFIQWMNEWTAQCNDPKLAGKIDRTVRMRARYSYLNKYNKCCFEETVSTFSFYGHSTLILKLFLYFHS